jgi:hypothetical protein
MRRNQGGWRSRQWRSAGGICEGDKVAIEEEKLRVPREEV